MDGYTWGDGNRRESELLKKSHRRWSEIKKIISKYVMTKENLMPISE